MTLEDEEKRATDLLAGKVVDLVWRHRSGEVVVQFTDGTRFFVDSHEALLELSVTEGRLAE